MRYPIWSRNHYRYSSWHTACALSVATLVAVSTITVARAETEVSCADWDGVVAGSVKLAAGCVFTKTVKIASTDFTDGVTPEPKRQLDCNGGTISVATGTNGAAIEMLDNAVPDVDGKCPQNATYADNVVLKNCRVENLGPDSGYGISLQNKLFTKPVSGKCGAAPSDPFQYLTDAHPNWTEYAKRHELRKLSVKNVTLDNVTFLKTGRSSVVVRGWSTGFLITNSRFGSADGSAGSGQRGVYFEPGSTANRVELSTFTFAGGAEAVSLDGAPGNVLNDNEFWNYPRGIMFFTNCGEGGVNRHDRADGNTISNNYFHNSEVGIWIASRQGMPASPVSDGGPRGCDASSTSENVVLDASMQASRWTADSCANLDPPSWFSKPAHENRFFFDYAKNNVVEGNEFSSSRIASIIVADSGNVIRGNKFTGLTHQDVCIGSRFLEVVNRRPSGNILSDNVTTSHAESPAFGIYNGITVQKSNNTDGSLGLLNLLLQR